MAYHNKFHEHPSSYSPDIKCVKADVTDNGVITGNDIIKGVTRKGLWVMASSPSHLTTLSIRNDGITNSRKLKSTNLENLPMAHRPFRIS
jgi:hypothetical protein